MKRKLQPKYECHGKSERLRMETSKKHNADKKDINMEKISQAKCVSSSQLDFSFKNEQVKYFKGCKNLLDLDLYQFLSFVFQKIFELLEKDKHRYNQTSYSRSFFWIHLRLWTFWKNRKKTFHRKEPWNRKFLIEKYTKSEEYCPKKSVSFRLCFNSECRCQHNTQEKVE